MDNVQKHMSQINSMYCSLKCNIYLVSSGIFYQNCFTVYLIFLYVKAMLIF
jgi:hypothetical protein